MAKESSMSTMTRKRESDEIAFSLTSPNDLDGGIQETIEAAVTKAISILRANGDYPTLYGEADKIAELIVGEVRPSVTLIQERMERMKTIKRIFEEEDWLPAEEINAIHAAFPGARTHPASDWKRRGRIFSVPYRGKDYYPRYQFDTMYQPLPVIKDILDAYGEHADPWSLAAWFHFPNSWIVKDGAAGPVPMAPKDALDRSDDVLAAARKRRATYMA
jgi:hypothetical protein